MMKKIFITLRNNLLILVGLTRVRCLTRCIRNSTPIYLSNDLGRISFNFIYLGWSCICKKNKKSPKP